MKTPEHYIEIATWPNDVDRDKLRRLINLIQRDALRAAAEIELGANSKDHNADCGCFICDYRKAILAMLPPAARHHTKHQTPQPCHPEAPPRHD